MTDRWTPQDLADYQARRDGGSDVVDAYHRSCGQKISREVKRDYKAEFEQQLDLVGIKFDREMPLLRTRKWRADWRVKGTSVLIEFEGGLFAKRKAGHSSVSGILRDIEKYNEATLAGWFVIRITPKHVTSGQALRWVEAAIELDRDLQDAMR